MTVARLKELRRMSVPELARLARATQDRGQFWFLTGMIITTTKDPNVARVLWKAGHAKTADYETAIEVCGELAGEIL